MVDLAVKNMLYDKLRFLITVAGVAFAVMLVFVQTGLFFGLLDKSTITIQHFDAELWVTSKNTPNIDFAHAFPENYVQRVRSVPGVARADNLIVQFMIITLPSGAEESTVVYAMEDFQRWNFPWKVLEGNLSDLRRGKYMFMDDSAGKRFGKFSVGDYREVIGQRLKIIGRTKEALSFTTTPVSFVDYRVAQDLSPSFLNARTTYILVKLLPGADINQVKNEIQRRLPYNDVHTKEAWITKTKTYWTSNTGIGINMILTVFLGCLVGIVVVAQTLYTSTMEHIKEFATVKAIGGSNKDIYLILAKQSIIAAITGFVMGYIPAYFLAPIVAKIDLKLIIDTQLIVIVFVGTVLLCLSAAIISFRKVASVDPALVFRG
jgi:putative ABC transport system permease protein